MSSYLASLTGGLSNNFQIAAEMLLIGVAYQESRTAWRVISIEGDDLGFLSTFMVSSTACMLKKQGLRSNASEYMYGIGNQPFVTFAHDPKLSQIPDAEIQMMLDRRFRNPRVLM